MKEDEKKVAAEMQLGRFAQKTHGLRMSEMHLRVLGFLELTDRFNLLCLIDDMVDELNRTGVRALGQNPWKLTKREAMLLLTDLRRWWVTSYCNDVVACCDKVSEQRRRIAALEIENEKLNDGWTNRVTYDNVVEQIAACEDPSERDEARKLFEPMLKRDMARKFREDIRRKVQEMHGEEGGREIHNHFEAGSTPQVFNGKVSGATFNPSQRS